MKNLKYILFTFFLVSYTFSSWGQQVNTLYFMNSVPQSMKYNPAKQSDHKFTFAFPVTNISMHAFNQFNYNDVTYTENGSTFLDIDGFLNILEPDNSQLSSVSSELFGVYYQKDKFGFNLSANYQVLEHLTYSKGLFETILKGPASDNVFGVTQDLKSVMDVYAFYDISLGGNYRINDKFVVGATFKVLFGTHQLKANVNGTFLQEDTPNMKMSMGGALDLRAMGLGDIVDEEGQIDINDDDLTGSLSSLSNTGFAIDLGAVYEFNDALTFEASVRNLGALYWKNENGYSYSAPLSKISFSGMDPGELLDGNIDGAFPSIGDSIAFEQVDTLDVNNKSTLPTIINLASTYEVWNNATAGVLFSQMFYQGIYYPSLTLSIDKQFGKFFGLGLSYTMDKTSYANLGALVSFGFPGFQMYVVSDNLLSAGLNWDKAKTANVRFGVNLPFGKVEKEEKMPNSLKKRLKN